MLPKTGGERSGLRFKRLQGSAAGTENAAPLAVPGAAIGGRSRLGLADRCAKRFLLHMPRRRGEKRALFQVLAGQCGRDGKRGPSCGARRSRRRTVPPRLCRPQRQKVLAVSATGGARTFCPRLPALGSKSGEQSEKPRTKVRGFFWRRRRDLNLLRRPSCGARRGHRRAQPPWPCRPLRQKILPASAAGGGRDQIPANKVKSPARKCGAFSGGEGGI